MYDKIIFYNHFGNGDIFESREFVKEYMQKIPASEYFYANGKPEYLLDGLGDIKHTEVTELMDARKAWIRDGNNLYINTWIGRDSKYVLPGIGCVVEELYVMHNDILASLGLSPLDKGVYNYIPELDLFDLIKNRSGSSLYFLYPGATNVLICNGPVHSNQAYNFDFDPIISKLSIEHPELNIILTSESISKGRNIVNLSSWNLNELAFISMYCNTIIGRNSGPHVFAQNLNNWNDSNKACLSFTYKEIASHFILSHHFPMKKYWSPATDVNGVYNKIVEVLNR